MAALPWQAQIDLVKPHIVRIMTPRGSGTGFLLYHSATKGFSAVAMAAHVVNSAHFWEEPIRLQHAASGKSIVVREGARAVLLHDEKDVAAIAFRTADLDLPDSPLVLSPSDKYVRAGVEIGWLGFPAVTRELCFFSGRVSTYVHSDERYLVDGVAINGVSGGPAFSSERDGTVSLMGVVSAYIPNRATGELLPGLAVVTDIVELHQMVASFKSLEDAQAQQTPPADAEGAVSSDKAPEGAAPTPPNTGLEPSAAPNVVPPRLKPKR